jgi:hypothetical protein
MPPSLHRLSVGKDPARLSQFPYLWKINSVHVEPLAILFMQRRIYGCSDGMADEATSGHVQRAWPDECAAGDIRAGTIAQHKLKCSGGGFARYKTNVLCIRGQADWSRH